MRSVEYILHNPRRIIVFCVLAFTAAAPRPQPLSAARPSVADYSQSEITLVSSFSMDEDFDHGGPKIVFDYSDSDSEENDRESGRRKNYRIETRAMAYLRLAGDLQMEKVPEPINGLIIPGEEILSGRLHGRAEQVSRFGQKVKFKVEGRMDAELSFDGDLSLVTRRFEGLIWDTHIDFYFSNMDLRFGNQFLAWGTADLLSPNDVINPRDLRRGFLERPEDLRLPILALTPQIFVGNATFSGVWVPIPRNSRIELLRTDYAILGPLAPTSIERRVGAILLELEEDPLARTFLHPLFTNAENTGYGIEDGELGISSSLYYPAIDLFAFLFYGHQRLPLLRLSDGLREYFTNTDPTAITSESLFQYVAGQALAGNEIVSLQANKRLHIGSALATRLEPLGIKLDVAYGVKEGFLLAPAGAGPLQGEFSDLDQFGSTLSLDYNYADRFSTSIEAQYTKVLGVPSGKSVYQMNRNQRLILGTLTQWLSTSRRQSLEILAFFELTSAPSYALAPSWRYSPHGALDFSLNLFLYGGPRTSLAGLAARDSSIHLTFQYNL